MFKSGASPFEVSTDAIFANIEAMNSELAVARNQTPIINPRIFGGDNLIYNSPEYSLILGLTNKILLKNINNITTKINKIETPTEQYINHLLLPSPPSQIKWKK